MIKLTGNWAYILEFRFWNLDLKVDPSAACSSPSPFNPKSEIRNPKFTHLSLAASR